MFKDRSISRPTAGSLFAAAVIATVFTTYAGAENNFEINGSMRVRTEAKSNADFNSSASDPTASTATRMRLDMKFHANEDLDIFFQPQFTKVWGQAEYVPSGAGANTSTGTSGTTHDTGLDVHQAYGHFKFNDSMMACVGRKELNYGDQLLVGGVGWNNVGRSFDLVSGTYKYEIGQVDVFNSKVTDRNVTSGGAGDQDFSGAYSTNKVSDQLKSLDAYVLYKHDGGQSPETSTAAYGLRAKSDIGALDYRAEATFENVKSLTESTDDNQYDLEVGYMVLPEGALRISGEYFASTKNYDQLYPTGHKWLGYADQFSRRNIKGFRIGLNGTFAEKWTASLDYHNFQRSDKSFGAYNFSGTSYGTTGESGAVASEVDLVVGYKVRNGLSLEGGYAQVNPDSYLKDNVGSDKTSFYYLQLLTSF